MQVNCTELYSKHKVNIGTLQSRHNTVNFSNMLTTGDTCYMSQKVTSVSQTDPQYNERNCVKTRTRCITVNIYTCINTYIFYNIIHTFIIWLNRHFFSMILKDASEHIGLISALRILFHMIGPWHLIPVLVKFDTHKGMCKCWALLVLCSWIV